MAAIRLEPEAPSGWEGARNAPAQQATVGGELQGFRVARNTRPLRAPPPGRQRKKGIWRVELSVCA